MISAFFKKRRQQFIEWWSAPATPKDRRLGALVGFVGFFWIGGLGRIMLGSLPVSLSVVGWWALGSSITGLVLGIAFPKVITCVGFPFSTFGIGGGS